MTYGAQPQFEQGPIRPPSEAGSLLLRFTRNCPWNKCSFCPVYKGQPFSRRSLEEILADIDAVAAMLEELRGRSSQVGGNGEIPAAVVQDVLHSRDASEQFKRVALWAGRGQGNVFIQDANSLIMKTEDLIAALRHLRRAVPLVKRVTCYARSSTLVRKGLQDLQAIREAGLDRVHVGMESGSDRVLKLVNKGASAEKHVQAGQLAVQSGLTLSEYIMPGLGGREHSREHALETARVLNQIDPQYIRLRSLQVIPGTPLADLLAQGGFSLLSDDETVREIRLLIQSLEGIGSQLASDHIMNLLEEVQGTFPQDKPHMLEVIDGYLQRPDTDKLLYRLGRRGGALRSVQELDDPGKRSQLERARRELESSEGKDLESIIGDMGIQGL
jgi:radical SAM superfamily enzyme YgiQ (UPF0313 family)